MKPLIKDTPKEDNKDKKVGPEHVHYSEVPLYTCVVAFYYAQVQVMGIE